MDRRRRHRPPLIRDQTSFHSFTLENDLIVPDRKRNILVTVRHNAPSIDRNGIRLPQLQSQSALRVGFRLNTESSVRRIINGVIHFQQNRIPDARSRWRAETG